MLTIDNHVRSGSRKFGLERQSILKKIFDRLIAIVLLIFSLPLTIAIAACIWVALGRPIFFSQSRAGLGARNFTILKFRTMRNDRGPDGILLPDHMRETRFTRLLRRTRLDELPQLISILRSDMAFVGPRPLLSPTIVEFGELGQLRCTVDPGMTGWAQVNGNTHLTARQKLALDIWYVAHQSLALDMLIVLLTVRTIVLGEKTNQRRLEIAEKYLETITAKSPIKRTGL